MRILYICKDYQSQMNKMFDWIIGLQGAGNLPDINWAQHEVNIGQLTVIFRATDDMIDGYDLKLIAVDES